jgi:2-amino-4-hydroxy-6-hydroxymethyldihydropteridine diphosphokinase
MHDADTHQVCLSLGSNQNAAFNLQYAARRIAANLHLIKYSSIWRTPPIGMGGDDFLNAAVLAISTYNPYTLKCNVLRPIEVELGRVRSKDKFAPRPIDIDILTVDNTTFDQDLWQQAHLAIPAAEVIPEFTDRSKSWTLLEKAKELNRNASIKKTNQPLYRG